MLKLHQANIDWLSSTTPAEARKAKRLRADAMAELFKEKLAEQEAETLHEGVEAQQVQAQLQGLRQQVIDTFLTDEITRLRAERDEARAEASARQRELLAARTVARYLWRLDGVAEQWTPPENDQLGWLTREYEQPEQQP